MSLIRYQGPQGLAWPALGRLSNLRDELDSLFELPFLTNFGNPTQLFSGWSPALDLYQSKDNVTAVVELPGMRKEDIEISLHDGTLTISGERKRKPPSRIKPNARSVMSANFAAASRYRHELMRPK